MFRLFAAASGVASLVIAFGVAALLLNPLVHPEKLFPIFFIWCLVPAAWGIWALLIPASWVPKRLALWGAALGLIAGCISIFVLNLPSRVFSVDIIFPWRVVAVLASTFFYYLLWLLVRRSYKILGPKSQKEVELRV